MKADWNDMEDVYWKERIRIRNLNEYQDKKY